MGTNDRIVLDSIIEDLHQQEGLDKGITFEKFAFQQILKDYALSPNQLEDGWVDGGGDGGVDGFFVIVNGYPYSGDAGFHWPRENPHITVWVITCKHKDGFQEAPLASLHMTLSEFWDCGKANDALQGAYSDELLQARTRFLTAYSALARLDPFVDIHLVYATRGDTSVVADAIKARMAQLVEQAKGQFSKSCVTGTFIGARELLQYYRKVKDECLLLPFVSFLCHDDNNYVIITKLKDYYSFVQNEEGKLRRYLFDSNVRDFLGYNSVNDDIDNTLRNPSNVNFWWLNNGITILADNAHIISGKTLCLQGVQIVNGLQTTETLYRHFASGRKESLDTDILIKVLTSQDTAIRSRIIQATNNQSNVASYSLHATDDIQRNIEEVLNRAGYYYERRDHYYKNEGMPAEYSITPLELAKGYLSIVFKNPVAAASLRNKFMRNSISYDAVFSSDFPVDGWILIAAVWLAAGRVYREKIKRDIAHQSYCNRWTPLVVYSIIAKLMGSFAYTTRDLSEIQWSDDKNAIVESVWRVIEPHFTLYKATSRNRLANPKLAYEAVLQIIANAFQLQGVEFSNKRQLPRIKENSSQYDDSNHNQYGGVLTKDLISDVQQHLPPQPWPCGIHRRVADELNVRPALVHAAIDALVADGVFYRQKDGVVYDANGIAILVDNRRCSQTVAEINAEKLSSPK